MMETESKQLINTGNNKQRKFMKMKLNFGLLVVSLANVVYCEYISVSAVVIKYPNYGDGKVYLNLIKNGVSEANEWFLPEKFDPNCKKDCTNKITYSDELNPIYINSKSLEYNFDGHSFHFNKNSSTYFGDKCIGINNCRLFVISYNGKFDVFE
ncbi:hypothetical protein BB559_004840 [Furculomyces boomerangus]|uniref:Uncharacterized protein n=1 Tax=Furculomyces boomerangus TaxID=61424 RepID=A0A2T9YCD1_9FUNG|nr:hypothetical protein BB559_004840 [Furculomyces boomerangus]